MHAHRLLPIHHLCHSWLLGLKHDQAWSLQDFGETVGLGFRGLGFGLCKVTRSHN